MAPLQDSLNLAIVIIPKVTGSISMIASAFITRSVIQKWRKRGLASLPMKSRLVLSMSVADIGSSIFGHILGTWLVPASIDGNPPLAAGNQATCNMQSFLFEFLLGAGCFSNLFLAISYWLLICRGKTEKTLKQWKYQIIFLGFPWVYGISTNAPKSLFAKNSPPAYKNLWFCQATSGDDIVELAYAVIWCISILMLFFCVGSLTRFVYKTERKTDKYRISREERITREKTLQVSRQGIYYVISVLVIFIPLYVYMFVENLPPWFFIFLAIVYPSQGTLNALVYFRPKYIADQHSGRVEKRSSIVSIMNALDITTPEFNLPASLADSVYRSTHRRRSTFSVDVRKEPEPEPNRCDYKQQHDCVMSGVMEESMGKGVSVG